MKTELSGNFVDLCPVGALTSKPYAFRARNWELQQVDSVDFFDTLTTDIVVHSRNSTKVISTPTKSSSNNQLSVNVIGNEKIFRILPGTNTKFINWISDRTRYAFDGLNRNRLVHPIVITDTIDTYSDFGYKKSHWKAIIQKKVFLIDCSAKYSFLKH
jgi:NADH dehydrogenase/NADH:ubiquinone oxidoreductase subunit G